MRQQSWKGNDNITLQQLDRAKPNISGENVWFERKNASSEKKDMKKHDREITHLTPIVNISRMSRPWSSPMRKITAITANE